MQGRHCVIPVHITGDRVEEVIMSFCSPHPAPPRPAMVLFVNNALIVPRYQTSRTAGQSNTLAFHLKPGDVRRCCMKAVSEAGWVIKSQISRVLCGSAGTGGGHCTSPHRSQSVIKPIHCRVAPRSCVHRRLLPAALLPPANKQKNWN